MKKKILYGIVAMMCATIGGVKAYDGLTKNNMSALMVENIEALTSGDVGEARYTIVRGNCTVTTTVDGDLTVTICGKKFKISGFEVGANYTKSWSEVTRDCQVGTTHYECTPYECSDFFKDGKFTI